METCVQSPFHFYPWLKSSLTIQGKILYQMASRLTWVACCLWNRSFHRMLFVSSTLHWRSMAHFGREGSHWDQHQRWYHSTCLCWSLPRPSNTGLRYLSDLDILFGQGSSQCSGKRCPHSGHLIHRHLCQEEEVFRLSACLQHHRTRLDLKLSWFGS